KPQGRRGGSLLFVEPIPPLATKPVRAGSLSIMRGISPSWAKSQRGFGMKRFLLLSAASLALAGSAVWAHSDEAPQAQSAPADAASLKPLRFGSWGVDLGARDISVRPGDDFDRYANG